MMDTVDSAAAETVFDLDGGRACLDFANTLSLHTGEHLATYSDLVAFAAQSQLLTQADADWLRAEAAGQPPAADHVVERARRLRSAVYAVFSSVAAGGTPAPHDVGVLNAELGLSLRHACVEEGVAGGGFRYGWQGRELDMPLWGISRSAADLLVAPDELRRVRECGGLDCQWLFLDTSKNRSRQWCSMQSCGNRQKARRHYQRVRARSAG